MVYQFGERKVTTATNNFYIAPSADVIGSVHIGDNVSIWFNAVVRADHDQISIGDNSNIQDGAVLHIDPKQPMTIGCNVTVGHNAMIHCAEVGDNTLVGIGAVLLNGAKIGKNCVIGANALVTENTVIPDNSLVLGSPAKVVKEVGEDKQDMLVYAAQYYVKNGYQFKEQLKLDSDFNDHRI
jgi:carbonic anhydrase/acetyltransferase-like protein (isoleucine patch superfamily)